jgi:hypothetical protein
MTQTIKYTLTQYEGMEIKQGAIDLMELIKKKRSDLVFKFKERIDEHHNRDKPRNFNYFEVFMADDPDFCIGSIGQFCDGDYYLNYLDMENGRWSYEAPDYTRRSKNIKTTASLAIKHLRTPDMKYIENKYFYKFGYSINEKSNDVRHKIHRGTNNSPDHVIEEMFKLIDLDYQTNNTAFMQSLKFLKEEREYITKYKNFDPEWYGVWVRPNKVIYRKRKGEQDNIVADRSQLPQVITDKMAVLDIMTEQDYIEDIGLKEKDNVYWVMV